jgi:hypothetical protein
MAEDRSDYTIHDYDPVNKYIEDKARLRRTKSFWGYSKSFALILLALGLFIILVAYAYWLLKRPYDLVNNVTNSNPSSVYNPNSSQINPSSNREANNLEQEIIEKNKTIKKLENKLSSSNQTDNQDLKNQLEKIENEKKELQNQLTNIKAGNIKYDLYLFRNDTSEKVNGRLANVSTRYVFNNSNDEKPTNISCYVKFPELNVAIELGDEFSAPEINTDTLKLVGTSQNEILSLRNKCKWQY